MPFKEYEINAEDLQNYLSDNGLWVETYARLGLFGKAATDFEPGSKAPKTFCPVHGGKSGEAFGFIAKGARRSDVTGMGVCNSCGCMNSFKMVMETTHWSFPYTLEQLAMASGYKDGIISGVFKVREKSPEEIAKEKHRQEQQRINDQKNMDMNALLWNEAFKLTQPGSEPARLYFRNRHIESGMDVLGDEVRYHPGVHYNHITYTSCIITFHDEGVRYWWLDKDGNQVNQPAGKPIGEQRDIISKCLPLDHRNAEPARLLLANCNPQMAEFIKNSRPMYHSGIGYRQYMGKLPCILSRIRNPNGTPVNLHQTFITLDGKKADVPAVKKIRSRIEQCPIFGGALQLCPPTPVLGVGEGLETVLSAVKALDMPGWPLLNANQMGNWIPPVGVRHVFIFEDPDPAGEEAAKKLADRLAEMGITSTRCNPKMIHPDTEMDWNEILINFGPDVFPYQNWMDMTSPNKDSI